MKRPVVVPEKKCEYCQGPIPATDISVVDRRRFCSDRHRWLAWEQARFLAILRRERLEREERTEAVAL